jgi:hypothetical protein
LRSSEIENRGPRSDLERRCRKVFEPESATEPGREDRLSARERLRLSRQQAAQPHHNFMLERFAGDGLLELATR